MLLRAGMRPLRPSLTALRGLGCVRGALMVPKPAASSMTMRAALSTVPPPNEGGGEEKEKTNGAMQAVDFDDYDDYEEPTTASGKVAMWTRTLMQLGFLGAIAVCFTMMAIELFPGPTGSSSMYTNAFEIIRSNAEVQRMTGEGMSAYGRVVGRRHIDSHKYEHEDGSSRTRIRFNVMGPKGRAMVWAEMSDRMGEDLNGEFAYLIVQDQRTGRVLTVQDNRSRLDALPPVQSEGLKKMYDQLVTKISS
jgi:hypothetical protein